MLEMLLVCSTAPPISQHTNNRDCQVLSLKGQQAVWNGNKSVCRPELLLGICQDIVLKNWKSAARSTSGLSKMTCKL
jgi:hypothetical protein